MLDCAQVAATDTVEDYIDDLWFTLHHSEDAGDCMLGLRWYLDDSGSDDGSPLVTCGGLVMSRIDLKHFNTRWATIYKRNKFVGYTLEPPLHMSDFVGMGKYAGLRTEFKRAFFREVVKPINAHKAYSLSIAIRQQDFVSELSEEVRKGLIGPYAFAFFCVVLAHQTVSKRHSDGPFFKTAYLVDRGFGHQAQLNEAHRIIVEFEQAFGGFRHTGSLATDTDDDWAPLQAADAIAWASRKLVLAGSLPEGFEPLGELLREDTPRVHVTIALDREAIKMFAKPVNNWIAKTGTMPKLADVLSQRFDGVSFKLKS